MRSNHTAVWQRNEPDETVAIITARIHGYLWRQSAHLPANHTAAYWRRLTSGQRAMSLCSFVMFLRVIHWIGERIFGGRGQQWIIAVLQPIADEFGLEITPKGQRVENVKPAEQELAEYAIASARVQVAISDADNHGICTAEEAYDIKRMRDAAVTELDQSVAAVTE